MSKRIDYVVAAVLTKTARSEEFLAVKRPMDDPDLRNSWGLPAITMKPGELPEEAARRICREKLDCEARPVRFLGIMFQKRNSYDIFLMDVEMELVEDSQPDVARARTATTKYVAQKWTSDPMDLMESARNGSCCSSILLSDKGLLNRDEWIASLEGSDTVA